MKKNICLGIVCIAVFLVAGCKKEGVSLVDSGLRDEPTDRKGAFKWLKGVNRGLVVRIVEEQKDGDWMKIQLPDGTTEGWIQKSFIHKGKKRVIAFTGPAELYEQPDTDAKKLSVVPAGTRAIVLRTKDKWFYVNVNWGQDGWVRAAGFKEGADVRVRPGHEVNIKGIGRSSVEASAALPDGGGYTYTVMNLFDGSPATTWQVGNAGIGEWVEIIFPETVSVAVSMINGFVKIDPKFAQYGAGGDLFLLNNRVKSMKVEYWNAQGVKRDTTVNFDDGVRGYQSAGNFRNIARIRFIIDGVYKGKKWNDTALAEIKIERQ